MPTDSFGTNEHEAVRAAARDFVARAVLPGRATGAILSAVVSPSRRWLRHRRIQLRARRQGDRYILHGAKTWCSFANRAHLLAVLVRTDQSKRHH